MADVFMLAQAEGKPGCWNRDRPEPGARRIVQDGWTTLHDGWNNPSLIPRYVYVEHRMSRACGVVESASYEFCNGCAHQRKGSIEH